MLEFFDKFSESSFLCKDKRCWPIIVKTSKATILNTFLEVLPEYGYENVQINYDYFECFCVNEECEITMYLLNNGANIQINLSVFSTKIGKTYKKLKEVNRLLKNIFEKFIVE